MLLAIVLLTGIVTAAPLTVGAANDPYHAKGNCGAGEHPEKVQWYLFDDGSIAFFGDGAMVNYSAPEPNLPAGPWYLSNPMESLLGSKIAFEDGITNVGNYAFYLPEYYTFMLQTYNLDLPNSLRTIGDHAFENQNKLQKIAIPQNVTSIGTDAFKGCTNVKNIDIYCNPNELNWNASYFGSGVTCHVLPAYADQLEDIKTHFITGMTFEANLHAEQGLVDDGVERNIKAYFGAENSKVFGGAAPFIIVGTFSGAKKSVTHGNNGFASCVMVENDYYVLSSNQSGHLNKAKLETGGYMSGLADDYHPDLRLTITREYIGTNIVKMIYHLQNNSTTKTYSNLKLGSTGDIKIGADDTAAIKPLMETVDGTQQQVGFYMTSTDEYDKSGNQYATLGFIGKNVSESAPATFFYGQTGTTTNVAATGAYCMRLLPERIFAPGTDALETGEYAQGTDTGMSYYWDNITLAPGGTAEYAVLFSVYGAQTDSTGQEMIDEQKKEYYTIIWKNHDGTVLLKQPVEAGTTLSYPLEAPVKIEDNQNYYTFSGWSPDPAEWSPTENVEEYEFTAQYAEHQKSFFVGHSLTLGGDIGVYFYIDPKVADSTKYGAVTEADVKSRTKTVSVKFSWYDKNSEYQVMTEEADYDEDRHLFKARCNVSAAEMAYDIHAVAYINGKRYEEEENHYSVRDYGLTIINGAESEYPAKLKYLAKTMLDYGAKAQELFKRKTNINGTAIPLANQGINYTMEAHAIGGTEPNMQSEKLATYGLKFYGTSVVFLSKTTLRQYYQVVDPSKFESVKDQFVKNGSLYYLQKENIPAKDLDTPQLFTIGGLDIGSYSVLDFARVLQSEDSSKAEQDLGTAVYWYSEAAKAYYTQS